jgi:hypothetical protein
LSSACAAPAASIATTLATANIIDFIFALPVEP